MVNHNQLPNYGGQALIEGVMMRGATSVALAMRAPNQEIIVQTEPLGRIYQSNLVKYPFLRGLIILWDALALGMRALTVSANLQMGEDEKLEGPALFLTMGFSLVLGIGLFILLPAGVSQLGEQSLGLTPQISNLLEGVFRLGLLVGYISLISLMPDIKRVFAYHGAEHKTINAFEAGAQLTPETVSQYSLQHPRCGTSFLLTVVLLSVVLFSLLGPLPLLWRLAGRIILLPVLASLAYEYIRWAANHLDNRWVQYLIKPNLALQNLTTREPSHDMLEVAISAFQHMRMAEVEGIESLD